MIYGAFIGREMHASAELRALHPMGDAVAEAAFAVEREHQHHGLGSVLMDRIITAAQNRGIGQVHMICMRENQPMQRLAEKFGARIRCSRAKPPARLPRTTRHHSRVLDEAMHDTTAS